MKNSQKIVISIFLFLFTSLLLIILYSFLYYLPLKNNHEVFSEIESYQKPLISEGVAGAFGITIESILSEKRKVLFIDGREEEEFNNNKIRDSIHIRTPDLSRKIIANKYNIDLDSFDNYLFVIYCHDGSRSSKKVSDLNLENLKFLIDGIKVFDDTRLNDKYSFVQSGVATIEKDIREYDFIVDGSFVKTLISKNNELFIIDGRLNKNEKIKDSYDFRIGAVSSSEYGKKIKEIEKYNTVNILYIAQTYQDLFYAKLLFQRLIKSGDFKIENLHIYSSNLMELNNILNSKL